MKPKREALKRPARIAQPTTTSLKLFHWQATPALVSEGQKILANPAMKLALAVLRNDSPANHAFVSNVDIAERAMHQARTEGYHLCLNSIESLGTLIESEDVQIEADFGADELVPQSEPPDMTE